MENHSILVIDDEPIVRESIRDWLKDAGYPVSTAENGEEALQMMENKKFNVLVLDLRLPGQSGLEILKKAKIKQPEIKSIIITAYPTEESVAEAKKLGAIDYMLKPVVPYELEKLIRETMDTMDIEEAPSAKRNNNNEVKTKKAKKTYIITKDNFKAMYKKMSKKYEVIGPKLKQGKYVFDTINNFKELCMDYDLTIMPPTKYLLPAKEILLKYTIGNHPEIEPIITNPKRVLLGVHPYDIEAIELLDEVYMDSTVDPNYSARRNNTLIIGLDCLNPSPRSFASSMGTHVADEGYDIMLTDIGKKYFITVGTKKGADFLKKYAQYSDSANEDYVKQKDVKDKALSKYELYLTFPREKLAKLLDNSYDVDYWYTRSKTCLSCGSCVMVCPTCFCFDVKDEPTLNLKEGERYRQWDGCMLEDFARVATGENFRHDKASRFRHRIYKKGKYILEKYGRPGCVGCGRCAAACLADIASPLVAYNSLFTLSKTMSEEFAVKQIKQGNELYLPELAELIQSERLTDNEKVLTFKLLSGKDLGHKPGQFVEVSLLGIGEAPISVTSSPTRQGYFQLAMRNVGNVTNALHNLKKGAIVGIRGPLGVGFPISFMQGKDIIIIAGGIGLFPLRSLIQYIVDRRSAFGKVTILFGARTPEDRLFTKELKEWQNSPDLIYMDTVDKADAAWDGNIGVITSIIPPRVQIDIEKTVAITVGPPIMYRFVTTELKNRNISDANIIVSLERRMKCGIGKCGHCQMNGVYVCQEGPVFSLAELRNLREAI